MLYHLYVIEGQGTSSIAKLFGITRGSVNHVLKDLGIPLRPTTAHQTLHSKVERAKTIQELGRLSRHEAAVLQLLKEVGLIPIPLFAVGPFNIDIAFPDRLLGFEITVGGWHRSARKQQADVKKWEYLTAVGWRLVDLNHQRWTAEMAADAILAEIGVPPP